MGHVMKFLQNIRNNLRPHEKRYRFVIEVRLYCQKFFKFQKNGQKIIFCFVL